MPNAPLRPCLVPRCAVLTPGGGYCPQHRPPRLRVRHVVAGIRRGYYTVRWRTRRRAVLTEAAQICRHCGCVSLELEVDHVVPHRGDAELFWDAENLQALCPRCHGRKTAAGG
jgi:5-methylcytosine-specific restriction protein A